jgi:hypothetical protein
MGLSEALKRKLVAQTFDVVDKARNISQFKVLIPWLERLAEISPNSLLANLMLNDFRVRSAIVVDDNKLKELRNLAPSLDIIYRSAIEQAVRQDKLSSIGWWCKSYLTSQLGALDHRTFIPARVPGQGLGGIFLEILDRQGKVAVSANYGIQLNERRSYEFEAHNLPGQVRLKLQLPTLPGLKITVHKVSFIARGSKTPFAGDELLLLPKRGFIVAKNQSLITSSAGETLIIYPKSGQFPPSDKIVLQLEFVRLALFNDLGCIAENL